VSSYPWRERVWGQLMLALYRSGRQAEAVRAYQRVRHLLSEELGISPSSQLAQLEEAILLQRSELAWSRPEPSTSALVPPGVARSGPTTPRLAGAGPGWPLDSRRPSGHPISLPDRQEIPNHERRIW
jgi:hypothetical protein